MSRVLEFRAAARLEFDEAADWYGDRDLLIKVRFVEAVDKTIDRLAAFPSSYPLVFGTTIRRALVPGFPYAIFFAVDNLRINILSVFHTSRNPIIWRGRVD
jgi:toxin ParE1/3/4